VIWVNIWYNQGIYLKKMPKDIQFSIVLPCYNVGRVILKCIEITADTLRKKHGECFEIIVVNDGSKDHTDKYLKLAAIREPRLKVISYQENKGKGYATRTGLSHCTGKVVGFMDSDLDIPPQILGTYSNMMEADGYDCLVASKTHKNSVINRPFHRILLSCFSRNLIGILFQLKGIDTQVGLKVFKKDVIDSILADLGENRFAFDIELLVQVKKHGYRITQAPVHIHQTNDATNIGTISTITTFLDTMKIYRRMRTKVSIHSKSYALCRSVLLMGLLIPIEFFLKFSHKT